jgi:hypothetical protein
MIDTNKIANSRARFDHSTLADVIAQSQIACTWSTAVAQSLPDGFDEVDIAILEWIAAEGRRARASVASTLELTISAGRAPQQPLQLSHVTSDAL